MVVVVEPTNLYLLSPLERARIAHNGIEAHRQGMRELALVRRNAVRSLHEEGLSYAEIGQLMGVSRMQVCRLAKMEVLGNA